MHAWMNILAERLWVYLMTWLSNGGSAWRLGEVALHPVKCPKQVDDFNFMGEHLKLLHHAPKKHYDLRTTAKKIAEESFLGCLGAISHVVGVLNLRGDGVDVGSG